jgi:cephalosporin hydroxylase
MKVGSIMNLPYINRKYLKKKFTHFYNKFFAMKKYPDICYNFPELDEIYSLSKIRSDINDHLLTIFFESIELKPKLIVELGVRNGVSTFIFERVASLFNSVLISVDIEDCSNVCNYHNWIFIKQDDIDFGKNFIEWSKINYINHTIDILFIDTSHLYDHTYNELTVYIPLLSDHSKIIVHDTNMNNYYFRRDNSIALGWNNDRGVIKAIENYFNKQFNEKIDFTDFVYPFIIKHFHICNGLTILEKVGF